MKGRGEGYDPTCSGCGRECIYHMPLRSYLNRIGWMLAGLTLAPIIFTAWLGLLAGLVYLALLIAFFGVMGAYPFIPPRRSGHDEG